VAESGIAPDLSPISPFLSKRKGAEGFTPKRKILAGRNLVPFGA